MSSPERQGSQKGSNYKFKKSVLTEFFKGKQFCAEVGGQRMQGIGLISFGGVRANELNRFMGQFKIVPCNRK